VIDASRPPAPAAPATPSLPSLDRDELLRYSRHLLLPEVGVDGQRRLKAGRVLVVGAGGLGSPIALYLAAAGVGTLGLVDFDTVDLTNLQRQIIHGTSDVGRPKLDSARERIAEVNPRVRVETFDARLTSANALEILRGFDVIVDGTDNFATRYLVNDACVLLGRPNVYGSIFRFEGRASVFATDDGPCYRCVFPTPPPAGAVQNCAEGGVLGVLPGLIGTIQAIETVKLLLGLGASLVGRLLLIDALELQFRSINVRRNPACPACGTREITALVDYDEFCNGPGAAEETVPEIGPRDLAARMAGGEPMELIDVREAYEVEIARIPGARHIPLGDLEDAVPTLDRTRPIVVYCKGGSRSAYAVRHLRASGFAEVWNLAGGITRWSEEVDSGVVKY
jgi:adenylyltransferase/sulfurtransferase